MKNLNKLNLSLVLTAAVLMAAPAAYARPIVAAHPHTVSVHDHTPQVHNRTETLHHGS